MYPPTYSPIRGHQHNSKNILLITTPHVLSNTWGVVVSKIFLLITTPHVLSNTWGGSCYYNILVLWIYKTLGFWLILLSGSNWINNNVNTVRLARTYWGIPSSFFEIEVQYGPPAFGRRSILNLNFSEFRWYSPIRPRQTHSILSIQIWQYSTFLSLRQRSNKPR